MANKSCSACDELRNDAPNFVINGLTDTECTSLKNNTGLSPSNSNDNCTDLNNMNDCLVGNMADTVDAYGLCDWRTFMKKLIPNIWTVAKSIICAICGFNAQLKKIECEIKYLFEGTTFKIKESVQTDSAYIVLGKGCSIYNNDSAEHTTDILLNYIAGGLLRLSGSVYFYSGDGTFQDAQAVPNFDNGYSMATSQTRRKNSLWGETGRPASGGELVYEIRIKKSEYPQIKKIYAGRGGESNGGAYTVHFHVFDGDDIPSGQDYRFAYGQHGWCHLDGTAYTASSGNPYDDTYDKGHKVEHGWIYIQCRIHWVEYMAKGDNKIYSPYGWLGIRTDRDAIPC